MVAFHIEGLMHPLHMLIWHTSFSVPLNKDSEGIEWLKNEGQKSHYTVIFLFQNDTYF
jgi:hypothetical protein